MSTRKFKITIDGKVFEAEVEEIREEETDEPIINKKESTQSIKEMPRKKEQTGLSGGSIIAPMPGKIVFIKCSKGQAVKRGDVLLILEAMKMEQEIKAKTDGTVSEIKVSVGMTVQKEDILITIG
ncbi:MAG: biotin/lipoyl-binding protein [Proteobacteria bacterium]|nr:biotin/lipoyl-binding protein [Pseudomonadota bacterium]